MPGPLRVLFIDIETAPNVGYSWGGKYEVNIIEFIQPWFILCFGYKWLGEKETRVIGLSRSEVLAHNDKRLMTRIHSILSRADVVVAQNGDAFDVKKINTRLIVHKIAPPPPFQTIDTLKVARRTFSFNSNSLDDVCSDLEEGRKLKHRGFEMWKGCLAGSPSAWKMMKRYNKRDVELLGKYYLRLRPWIKNHPNLNVASEISACPKCGSKNFQHRGSSYSKTRVCVRFQCNDCYGWFRAVKGECRVQTT